MTRKKWLIFWLIALLLLFFACIFTHKDMLTPKLVAKPAIKPIEKIVKEPVEAKPVVKKEKVYKDELLKVTKNGKAILITGLLNNKDELKKLQESFGDTQVGNLKFSEDVKNKKLLPLVIYLKDAFSKFKNGYLEYADKVLTIDGVVTSSKDKDFISSMLLNIKDMTIDSNIVVQEPKPKIKEVEHISKLSISKDGNKVTISGTFSSQNELQQLVDLLTKKGLVVSKGICVVDNSISNDSWKVPLVVVVDDFSKFVKGAIQFDKNTFSISGVTHIKADVDDIHQRLEKVKGNLLIDEDVSFVGLPKKLKLIQNKISDILKTKNVRFVKNTATLINESKPVLDEVIEVISTLPTLKININGYTDSDGDAQSNLILSQNRADAVKNYLVNHGIKEKNLKAIGFGESNPLVKNTSAKNKQINRRVEFKIIGE